MAILAIAGTILFIFVIWSLILLGECEHKAYVDNFYKDLRSFNLNKQKEKYKNGHIYSRQGYSSEKSPKFPQDGTWLG